MFVFFFKVIQLSTILDKLNQLLGDIDQTDEKLWLRIAEDYFWIKLQNLKETGTVDMTEQEEKRFELMSKMRDFYKKGNKQQQQSDEREEQAGDADLQQQQPKGEEQKEEEEQQQQQQPDTLSQCG